jgi:hypothetical protein
VKLLRNRLPLLAWLALACSLPAGADAQAIASGTGQRLEPRLTLGSASARDDTLVPIAFTGPFVSLGARYALIGEVHSFEAELNLGLGVLVNRFDDIAAHFGHTLAAGYLYAFDRGPSSRSAVGAVLRARSEISYLASWDDAHGYWLATLAIGPALQLARPLGRGVWLEGRGELALFGLRSRPPGYRINKQDALSQAGFYFDRLFESAEVFSPLDVQQFELEALARFRRAGEPLGSGFGLGLGASFHRAIDPQPYAVLHTQVTVAYGFEL